MQNFTSINTIHSHPQIKSQLTQVTVSHGQRERKKREKERYASHQRAEARFAKEVQLSGDTASRRGGGVTER
jgi:hypothetical protein